jgi:hypothetical protein
MGLFYKFLNRKSAYHVAFIGQGWGWILKEGQLLCCPLDQVGPTASL